jgi:hypothetical protein
MRVLMMDTQLGQVQPRLLFGSSEDEEIAQSGGLIFRAKALLPSGDRYQ